MRWPGAVDKRQKANIALVKPFTEADELSQKTDIAEESLLNGAKRSSMTDALNVAF